jgi:hypothetical protein
MFAEAGVLAFKIVDQLTDVAAASGYPIFAVGEFAEQSGNYDGGHFEGGSDPSGSDPSRNQ